MQAAHSISSYFFQRPYAQQGPDPLPRGLLLRFTKQSGRSAEHVRVRQRCTKRAERGGDRPDAVRDMPVTLSHVRLHGLAPVPLTSPRCFSPVDRADEDAPGLSRCSGASGCKGPLLTPCSASYSSLLIGHVHTCGDSLKLPGRNPVLY